MEDSRGTLCRNRRLFGALERLRCGWAGQDRKGGPVVVCSVSYEPIAGHRRQPRLSNIFPKAGKWRWRSHRSPARGCWRRNRLTLRGARRGPPSCAKLSFRGYVGDVCGACCREGCHRDRQTAKAIGVTIPTSILLGADEVIWHKADLARYGARCPLSGVKRTSPDFSTWVCCLLLTRSGHRAASPCCGCEAGSALFKALGLAGTIRPPPEPRDGH